MTARGQLRFAILITVAVTALRVSTLVIPVFNQDEGYIAVQSHVIANGGVIYRDVVDRKPPLVQYIYAAVFAAVGDDSLIAVHVLAILWVTATALVIGAIMRRRAGPREGRVASWLFVVSSMALLPRDALAANFELWMLLPLCGAMLAAGRGRPLLDGVAGVLLGLAVFMKQPALVTLAPLAFVIWRGPRRVAGTLAMLGGLVAVFVVMIVAHDPAMLDWAFFGTGGYLATSAIPFAMLMALVWTGSFLIASAGVWFLVRRSAVERGFRVDAELWIWLATAFIAVAAGLRFLGHYHLQVVPPACLLAARPLTALVGRTRRRVIGVIVAPALVCAGLGFVMPNQPFDTDYRPVAAYLRAHTAETDRILVWGHFPEIYWASRRMPAMRFVHTGFMTGLSGARPIRPNDVHAATAGAWAAMFEDLAAHPPVYVVDLSPGAVRTAQYFPIANYPQMAAWLSHGYCVETIIDGMWLYRRRTGPCGTTVISTGAPQASTLR